jgi:DNA-binding transcriptional regulator YdaS (Cro superfamily)
MNALQKAVSIAGSQKALADQIGVVQSAVANWLKRESVPAEHCLPIEKATGGRVTRQELRPDDAHRIWPDLAIPGPAGEGLSDTVQPPGCTTSDVEINRLMAQGIKAGVVKDRRDPNNPGRRDRDVKAYAALDTIDPAGQGV